jgi:anti-sigma B factor antagonist
MPERQPSVSGESPGGAAELPPRGQLRIRLGEEGDRAVLSLAGELDMATVPALRQSVAGLLEQGRARVVVDMAELGFVDSTGIHALLESWRRAKDASGEMVLRAVSRQVRLVLEMVQSPIPEE